MASKIEIINNALIRIGCDLINSLTQENNKNAKIANQVYDMVRKEVLRIHPWNFAIKRVTIAASTEAPEFEFSYKFPLPADNIRIIRHYYPDEVYKVESGYILTNNSTCAIMYIADITDTTKFDSLFQEAFILKLAATMAPILTDSTEKAQLYLGLYEKVIRTAKQIDGQEDTPNAILSDVWLLSGDV